ncbi:MAG: 1-phosphofructokinase family hexose kinase, partial [Brevinema sp.]
MRLSMVITVTLNPAVDFHITLDQFIPGKTLSSQENFFYAGGKGLNVSRVLKNIGVSTEALAFVGGFTGNFIQEESHDILFPIFITEKTRINTKIKTSSEESEISGVTPEIPSDKFNHLLLKLKSYSHIDALVLSGSVPPSLPHNTYELLAKAVTQDTKIILDTRGNMLKQTLKNITNVFCIKPNKDEIGEFFSCEIQHSEQCLELAIRLKQQYSIQNIIVSLGSEGAYLLSEDRIYFAKPLKGTLVSSVGAGDSLVAGFI